MRYADHDWADFHAGMGEQPHDFTPHLVYADWLDEQGHPEAAEVIRRHVESFGIPGRSVRYQPGGHVNPVMTPGQFAVTVSFVGPHHHSVILDQRRVDDPARQFSWRTEPLHHTEAGPLVAGLLARGAATNYFTAERFGG